MESELSEFIEDIRKLLCEGRHHLDVDGKPFSGQATDMAITLWAKGYRNKDSDG